MLGRVWLLKTSKILAAECRTGTSSETLVFWSISARGGWHDHAMALADQLAGHCRLIGLVGRDSQASSLVEMIRLPFETRPAFAALNALYVGKLCRRQRATWLHLHGLGSEPFGLLTMILIRVLLAGSGCRVALTPHNSFGSRSRWMTLHLVRALSCCFAHRTMAFSATEAATMSALGAEVIVGDLVLPEPAAFAETSEAICEMRKSGLPVVGVLGAVRPDKNLEVAVDATCDLGVGLLIAGRDAGAGSLARSLTLQHDHVSSLVKDMPLGELLSLVRDVDCVLLPYTRFSQSAIAWYALRLGTKIVGPRCLDGVSDLGGFESAEPVEIGAAIVGVLGAPALKVTERADSPAQAMELYR